MEEEVSVCTRWACRRERGRGLFFLFLPFFNENNYRVLAEDFSAISMEKAVRNEKCRGEIVENDSAKFELTKINKVIS